MPRHRDETREPDGHDPWARLRWHLTAAGITAVLLALAGLIWVVHEILTATMGGPR